MKKIIEIKSKIRLIEEELSKNSLFEIPNHQLLVELDILKRNLQFLETDRLFEKFSSDEKDLIIKKLNGFFEEDIINSRMRFSNKNGWSFDKVFCHMSYIEKQWLIRIQIGENENMVIPTEPSSEATFFSYKEFFIKLEFTTEGIKKIDLDEYPKFPDQYNWKEILKRNIVGYNLKLFDRNHT
jgi:hypothetical protein